MGLGGSRVQIPLYGISRRPCGRTQGNRSFSYDPTSGRASMRRADLAHLTSLTVGCALFVACGDSTSPVPRKALAADAQAPNATTSWVNKGGSNCLAVTSQDSTTFPPVDSFGNTGWYFCPSTSSTSLYLAMDPLNPGSSLTLANISVLPGPDVPPSYNPDGSVA